MASTAHHTQGAVRQPQGRMLQSFHQRAGVHRQAGAMQHSRSSARLSPAHAVMYPDNVRFYTDYTIYTDEAAVVFKPIPPSFIQGQSKETGSTYYTLDRPGTLLLEFATALPPSSGEGEPRTRKYNWQQTKQQKLYFGLGAEELAEIKDFDVVVQPASNTAQTQDLEFVHEPRRIDANAGPPVRKQLRLASRLGGQRAGYTLTLTIHSGNSDTTIQVPITRPQFVLLKGFADYLIPRLYGFEYLFELAGQQPTIIYQQEQQPGQQSQDQRGP